MAKRKGAHMSGETKEEGPFDPQAELYKMAQQYKWDIGKRSTGEEGDVTNSMGMLTSIPEVDLGMEYVSYLSLLAFAPVKEEKQIFRAVGSVLIS